MQNSYLVRSRFGSWEFYKKALLLALPVMAQLLVQNLVSLVDNFMVAGLGDIKMAGVNITGQINMIFLVFTGTICSSGGIFMSQYYGAKDEDGMKHAFRFKLIVLAFFSILYTFFCLSGARWALQFMVRGNTNAQEILVFGTSYMQLIAWTWLPLPISAAISTSLREIGRVKSPLIISIGATLLNTFLNWVFIYGKLGAPRLEVKGAAIATIIARLFEAAVYIAFIRAVRPPFYSKLRNIFKIGFTLFKNILGKSGMILVSEMSWILVETLTAAIYNGRGGAEVVSGMSAGFAISNLFFISIAGVNTAVGVITGSTLGSGKLDEAREQKKWLTSGSFVFGLLFALLGSCASLLIPYVFGNLSGEAQVIARNLVLVTAFYLVLWIYLNVLLGISRSGGDTLLGASMDLIVNFLIVVPSVFLLSYFTNFGPVIMFAIIKLSDFIKLIYALVWIKNERWIKNLTGATT